MVSDKVLQALTSIFEAVADACDGVPVTHVIDEQDAATLNKVYKEAMKDPEVQAFYGELVDERHNVAWLGEEPDGHES